MPEEILRNPAVNPVVDTDGSSNAEHRRYNSTTDDLLDRIRQAVEAINGGGGGGGGGGGAALPIIVTGNYWAIYPDGSQTAAEYLGRCIFKLSPTDFSIISGVQSFNGIVYYPLELSNRRYTETPPIYTCIGRLHGNADLSIDFYIQDDNGNINYNLPLGSFLTIYLNNVFSLDILVLPESILSENPEENFFWITRGSEIQKYYIESFNGVPAVSTLHFDFDPKNYASLYMSIEPGSSGIKLEYQIKATYPIM